MKLKLPKFTATNKNDYIKLVSGDADRKIENIDSDDSKLTICRNSNIYFTDLLQPKGTDKKYTSFSIERCYELVTMIVTGLINSKKSKFELPDTNGIVLIDDLSYFITCYMADGKGLANAKKQVPERLEKLGVSEKDIPVIKETIGWNENIETGFAVAYVQPVRDSLNDVRKDWLNKVMADRELPKSKQLFNLVVDNVPEEYFAKKKADADNKKKIAVKTSFFNDGVKALKAIMKLDVEKYENYMEFPGNLLECARELQETIDNPCAKFTTKQKAEIKKLVEGE